MIHLVQMVNRWDCPTPAPERKAYGVFASTTIAYGPPEGNDQADLICQYFLEAILSGASLGRAALEARQRFIEKSSPLGTMNRKTLAQFDLYRRPFNRARSYFNSESGCGAEYHTVNTTGPKLSARRYRLWPRPFVKRNLSNVANDAKSFTQKGWYSLNCNLP